jgi:hypothetical protein
MKANKQRFAMASVTTDWQLEEGNYGNQVAKELGWYFNTWNVCTCTN